MIMNSKNLLEETYDVAVVGAGHAGCEAALDVRDWGSRQLFLL